MFSEHFLRTLQSGALHSLNSNTIWDLVRGHVVVRQLLPLVPLLDGAAYLCQLLPELLHGFLHWLLYEVLIRIHAQEQLRAEREETGRSAGARAVGTKSGTW